MGDESKSEKFFVIPRMEVEYEAEYVPNKRYGWDDPDLLVTMILEDGRRLQKRFDRLHYDWWWVDEEGQGLRRCSE